MSLEVREVRTAAEREACYHVRMVVFVDEQGVPPWEEVDADDETAFHIVALADGAVVGTARLVDKGDGLGKIGRVAVLQENRGLGVGRALMEFLVQSCGGQFHTLSLDAQVSVIPFYERLGFEASGDVFLDCGIEHRRMIMQLPVHHEPQTGSTA